MKLKVFTMALTAILLSVASADTAEAQGRGYNRGRGYAPRCAPRPNCNNYYGGNYNRGYDRAPRGGYVRVYGPAYNGGYYNGYGGGYTTTTVTYNVNGGNCNNGYYSNNGYYNNGYNNGGYYNNRGNCGNGYGRGPRRGW